MHTSPFKIKLAASVLSAFLLASCSDSKGPPDDDLGGDDKAQCTTLTPADYTACAQRVLATTSLSAVEIDSLARSCDEAKFAGPQTSAPEAFEAARAVVADQCH